MLYLIRSRIGFHRLSKSSYTNATSTVMVCDVLFHDYSVGSEQSGK